MTVSELIPAQTGWRIQRETLGDRVTVDVPRSSRRAQTQTEAKVVRAAVLKHIQALRELGQTRVNTREIALALNIPQALVEQAAAQLGDKGVKAVK